jgi:hypothetical protein
MLLAWDPPYNGSLGPEKETSGGGRCSLLLPRANVKDARRRRFSNDKRQFVVQGTQEEWRVRMQAPVETFLFSVCERLAKSFGDGKFDADRGSQSMRALVCLGLFALVAFMPASRRQAIDVGGSIPRFFLDKGQWICIDRNPRQVDRRDCSPITN